MGVRMTGEKRYGDDRLDVCPRCGGEKVPHSDICLRCSHAERAAKRKRTVYPWTRRRLHAMDKGYGPTCPECGGPKAPQSVRCSTCAGHPVTSANRPSEDTVYTLSRRESIVTFEHEQGGVRTLVCYGHGAKGQIADGLSRLPGDGWEVVCRSTPQSILTDLRRTAP